VQLGYILSDFDKLLQSGLVLHTRIAQRVQNSALSQPALNVHHQNFALQWNVLYGCLGSNEENK
jgi:hypothetical protein